MKYLHILLTLLLASFPSLLIAADPPGMLTYQGRVSVSGVNFDSATAGNNGRFQFDLVDNGAATTYWSSPEIALPVVKGLYSVNLGDTVLSGGDSIPASAFQTNSEVYLRVSFSHLASGALEVLSPDQRVTSVGYALKVQGLTLVDDNTAVGKNTLTNSTGANNTATGSFALDGNTSGGANSAHGTSALQKNTIGADNTASGSFSLQNNTDGGANTASGSGALSLNTTGSSNTAVGRSALQLNTTGSSNIALGNDAGINLTIGDHNIMLGNAGMAGESAIIRIGDADQTKAFVAGIRGITPDNADGLPVIIDSAGQLGTTADLALLSGMNVFTGTGNTFSLGLELTGGSLGLHAAGSITRGGDLFLHATGNGNTGVGQQALRDNTSGRDNTATGRFALRMNTTGRDNTATGRNALQSNTEGFENTASGRDALWANTTGHANTANGFQALFSNTEGYNNTASGDAALLSNTTGRDNTASGFEALRSNTTAGRNVAIGTAALKTQSYDNGGTVWNSENVAVGYGALEFNQPTTFFDGHQNTALGTEALNKNTTGKFNTAVGKRALWSNTTGEQNTASGWLALSSNTTGSYNTADGASALQNNTVGSSNEAFGRYALQLNTTGNGNTAIGSWALRNNTTATVNSAFGSNALRENTTGERNTACGHGALWNNNGSNNIALGIFTGVNLTTGDHNIMIGHDGIAAETATIRIGDADQTKTFVAGIRGITTGTADAIAVMIDSTGQLGTVSSSRRYKEDIHAMSEAASTTSDRLQQLRPVTFRYKQHEAEAETGEKPLQYGLIAEEVAEVFPELAVFNEEGQPETVKYHLLAPLLLNEVQKQREELEKKDRRVEELEERLESENADLRERLAHLEAAIGQR